MPGEALFGIEALREAVRRRAAETSLRATAAEVGLSYSGLRSFLRAGTPHPATRRKLMAWYTEHRRRTTRRVAEPEPGQADVDAAVALLVHYIRADGRAEVRLRRLAAIEERLVRETG